MCGWTMEEAWEQLEDHDEMLTGTDSRKTNILCSKSPGGKGNDRNNATV